MKLSGLGTALLVAASLAVAGCNERPAPQNDTAVLGANGPGPAGADAATLTDARGRPIPPPRVPAGVQVQMARSDDESALALWEQDGKVLASAFSRDRGWSEALPLEQIYGRASDPQLASNGRGTAMALWRHTVGTIQSLRFSHFDATAGWSVPDVVPGALPQPHVEGDASHANAPRLAMDADGHVTARWPSGFAQDEEQIARYAPGQGWSPAVSEAVAGAAGETPARAIAGSTR
jgi:hypothetical protein